MNEQMNKSKGGGRREGDMRGWVKGEGWRE